MIDIVCISPMGKCSSVQWTVADNRNWSSPYDYHYRDVPLNVVSMRSPSNIQYSLAFGLEPKVLHSNFDSPPARRKGEICLIFTSKGFTVKKWVSIYSLPYSWGCCKVYVQFMSNLMLALDAKVMLLFDAWHVKMDKRWWRASEFITSSLVVTADKEQVSGAAL